MSEQILTNCTTGGPVFVHVNDGRITRIRPIVFDETDAPGWTMEEAQAVTEPRLIVAKDLKEITL